METSKGTAKDTKCTKRWKIAVICLVIALVASNGIFAFILAKNNNEKAELRDTLSLLQKDKTLEESKNSQQNLDGFLVVEEWGMRLKIPKEFSEIVYTFFPLRLVDNGSMITLAGKFQPTSESKVVSFSEYRFSYVRYSQDNDPNKGCVDGGCYINCDKGYCSVIVTFALNHAGYNYYYEYTPTPEDMSQVPPVDPATKDSTKIRDLTEHMLMVAELN